METNIPDKGLSGADNSEHKRRVHYKGTHPHNFDEKYKEHNPGQYADTIAKVISKGGTPAGMHIPIMVNEILDFLQIQPGQTGLDATLGYGGHTERMLQALDHSGHLYALDIDPEESAKTKHRLSSKGYGDDSFTVRLLNFANIDQLGMKFDFILADLGVSSMQIDNPERGFSYKADGPLDLRLDQKQGITAAERLADISAAELEGMLIDNSDEPNADIIAKAIVNYQKRNPKIQTTSELRSIIENALLPIMKTGHDGMNLSNSDKKTLVKKTCQRIFQALRIDINNEFESLESFMEKLPSIMNPGGRAAILTFHSGEDRIVKQLFKQYNRDGLYSFVSKDVIRPSAAECISNSRARSTKLRCAIRSDMPLP